MYSILRVATIGARLKYKSLLSFESKVEKNKNPAGSFSWELNIEKRKIGG